jgi:hypothetical protein
MPDEGIRVEPKGKSVSTPLLVKVDWALWGILLAVVLYGLVKVSTERTSSPEAGRGLGLFAVLFLLALLAGAAALLNVAARRQSTTGLIALTVILAWPVVFLIADPAMKAYKARKYAAADAGVGDFTDPTLAAMARAIARNDSATLTTLLNGQRPPAGKDRAGNDLLGYALVTVRDGQGSASTVRALLDVGADPRTTRMAGGDDVVSYIINAHSPAADDALRALLEHGADPNVVNRYSRNTPLGDVSDNPAMVRALVEHGADIDRIQSDGTPAVVRFIGTRQWESARYLIEQGARLDVVNTHGLSVDYYLDDWKDSVFGDHPDGWDRVREAIAARRAAAR